MTKWFAYRHINGNIKVKRYDPTFGKAALNDAEESDFVDYVLQPYDAENRADAERIAVEELQKKEAN
jgi:hypothetical protein